MTSLRFNSRKRAAAEEIAAFDALPASVRDAINAGHTSASATVILAALLRGVSIEKIVETIKRSQGK